MDLKVVLLTTQRNRGFVIKVIKNSSHHNKVTFLVHLNLEIKIQTNNPAGVSVKHLSLQFSEHNQ